MTVDKQAVNSRLQIFFQYRKKVQRSVNANASHYHHIIFIKHFRVTAQSKKTMQMQLSWIT